MKTSSLPPKEERWMPRKHEYHRGVGLGCGSRSSRPDNARRAASQLGDVGDPLFLTPLIEAGQLEKARNLSRVGSLGAVPDFPGYSGFLTVNKQYGNNLFFWFFPAKENPEKAPVVLWLQGGPGSSSLFGLFVEHGPYRVAKGGVPELRGTTWAQRYSMLYIDSPVGAGFSFTQDDRGYARNEVDVGRDLHEALQQFFTLFDEYAANDFYATGESYAGKYVPAIAHAIDRAVAPRVKINLRGIAIGDGMVDPETMLDYADFLYQIGLVDRGQADYIRAESARAVGYIKQGRYMDAFLSWDKFFNLDALYQSSYFKNFTGLDSFYNFLLSSNPYCFDYYKAFVDSPVVRKAIHVGNLTFNNGDATGRHLRGDIMQSVKPWLASLMDKPQYKVLIYNGQLDIIIAYPLTDNFVCSIQWSGKEAFDKAERKIWKRPDGNGVAGYVRKVGNFTQVLVRDAGHILPFDQPEVALDLITRFIEGKPFDA
ncbi:probable serine carboxypeptidase CPVL isoform X1 [Dermacentor albipictus]|uniref:probable serine carboxypeptidase CPVL isoform X1 n=1 Tax=Dermacentor albipictus TaxID=60249 RepID=UPI0031FBA5B7